MSKVITKAEFEKVIATYKNLMHIRLNKIRRNDPSRFEEQYPEDALIAALRQADIHVE